MGHRIVVRIHKVNLWQPRERGFHLLATIWFQPFRIRLEGDQDLASLDPFEEAGVTILAGSRGHQPFNLDHGPDPLEPLSDPVPRHFADELVIRSDEAGVILSDHAPVENYDRNARFVSSPDRWSQRGRLKWRNQQHVHFLS